MCVVKLTAVGKDDGAAVALAKHSAIVLINGGTLYLLDCFVIQLIIIFGEIQMAEIIGTDGSDLRYGTNDPDVIKGLLGNDELYGGSGGDDVIIAGPENPVTGYSDNDIVYGDTFRSGATNDKIDGGYGNDTLYGDSYEGQGGGNDTIFGGLGDDVIYGGDGNDTAYGGYGNDTISGGTGNDYLSGDDGNDLIYGNDGDDSLSGSYGSDSLIGGNGNDTYYYVDASDVLTEEASGGIDTVWSLNSYTLGANVENLVLDYSAAIDGTGNSLNNYMAGNVANNSLYGRSGNDLLWGGDGNDTLDGGDGNDTLYGGAGDDYLNGRSGIDQMSGNSGNDKYVVDNAFDVVVENAAEGVDTIVSTIDYTLGANVENLTLTESAVNGTGNDLGNYMLGTAGGNVILGKGGDDLINGRGGNDVIVGGAGNDALYGDLGADKFRFDFQSEGIDLIRDFNRSEGDKIQITKSSFGATSLDQFSYNSTTGALSFGSTQFATIANKPAGFSVQTDVVLV